MRHSTRFILATTLAAGLVAAALPSPASAAAFTADQQKCRTTITKGGGALAMAATKLQTACHKLRDKASSSLDCNSISAADTKLKFPGAETKFTTSVAALCTGSPATLLFKQCPAPCDVSVPALNTFADVATCLDCVLRDNVEAFADDTFGSPPSPITNALELACHGSITKNAAALYNSAIKSVAKCQAAFEKSGSTSVVSCTNSGYSILIDKARQKAIAAIAKSCAAPLALPDTNLDPCGASLTAFDLASCVADAAASKAQEAVTDMLTLPTTTTTTTTVSTTTTTLPPPDPNCPSVGELTLLSKMSNEACTTNADCTAPRTCDPTSLRCQTKADLDSGWTGLAHNSDINDNVTTRATLNCHGPASPACGECQVTGIDPSEGNCRCKGDNHIKCDQPFAVDAANCGALGTFNGANQCQCYFGAPIPLNSAGVAACLLNRFSENLTGTANVDAGSGTITAKLRTQVFTGILDKRPCPVCAGKCSDNQAACEVNTDCGSNNCVQDIAGDGIRGGICKGQNSDNEGQACDISSTNASFPGVYGASSGGGGGGGYSLDCLPGTGALISGEGLAITLTQTTGTVSLPSALDCDGDGPLTDLCPCLSCSRDTAVGCSSNADCASQGGACSGVVNPDPILCTSNTDCTGVNVGPCQTFSPTNHRCARDLDLVCTSDASCVGVNIGTCDLSSCTSNGVGEAPQPNGCDGGTCDDQGGGEGLCATGPDDYFCSGLVRADGTPMLACSPNVTPTHTRDADCQVNGDNGTCTVQVRRPCFLDPIVATGHADPTQPLAGGVFCISATAAGPAINSVAGLPGPGRSIGQGTAKTFCPNTHQYVPGGGCPP